MKNLAKIIDAMGMIGVVMRKKYCIKMADARRQQLFAQIRPGIDEDVGFGLLDEQRDTPTAVFRIAGVTVAPVPGPFRASNARYAARRSGTEHSDLHAGGRALLNRRKKFAVVVAESASGASPRRLARQRAVWTTKLGSQVLPRIGTGARNGASVSTSRRSAGIVAAVSCKSRAFLKVTIPEIDI